MRIGLGYVKGVREEEMESLVGERERGGLYRGIADLASRSGAGRDGLERLAWAGAMDQLVSADAPMAALMPGLPPAFAARGGRREALWEMGVSGTGVRHAAGTQMSLPLGTSGAPALEPLGSWGEAIADYRSTGMTLGRHPMELLRDRLDRALLRSTDLETAKDGRTVEVGGMVVARQRPETAKGIVFMLLEDERGTVNLIVPPPVYERFRPLVRTAPLLRATGRLERREGTINVLVSELAALEYTELPPGGGEPGHCGDEVGPRAARRQRPPKDRRRVREHAIAELRAVAPAPHSFGSR